MQKIDPEPHTGPFGEGSFKDEHGSDFLFIIKEE